MSNTVIYRNCRIFTGSETLTGKAIVTQDSLIRSIVDEGNVSENAEDLHGLNIAPAFIDLQIYGANNHLFSAHPGAEAIAHTYNYCLGGGCSQFMITMATNSIEIFLQGMDAVRDYWQQGGKGLLGLHLEGPYMNPVKKGAHIEKYVKKPTEEEVKMLLEKGRGVFKMITLAPEICDDKIIHLLIDNGIIVSAGHSNATYEEAQKGFAAGIPAATHLFNAMSPFQSREPGLVGAIYNNPGVKSSIVADGVHVDFVSLKISKQVMGNRLFFITDAVTNSDQGGYQHIFKGDRYTLPDGTLSGSSLTMMQSVKNVIQHAGIPLEEALRMASAYPAELLKTPTRYGKIAPGFAAEFVVFDDTLTVKQVIC